MERLSEAGPLGDLLVSVEWATPDRPSLALRRSTETTPAPSFESLALLDVSTNADLLGVIMESTADIAGAVLAAQGASLEIFTVPGISWEPVKDEATASIIVAPNDGFGSAVQVDSVRLSPVEPLPLLRGYVEDVGSGRPASATFMLPFGLLAEATLESLSVPNAGASFELISPTFADGLEGGLQLKLRPTSPEVSTAGFRGLVQATASVANDILGPAALLVEEEFGIPGTRGIVPVRRVDISGYGTSMFSDWRDPAEVSGVAEARFDVLVGRTSYDVIQLVSVLYPWGIRVVRTITLARQAGGRVLRTDTGWQPLSDGAFDLPPGTIAHKGPVTRAVNVHNIRDNSQTLQPGAGLVFQTVAFDADLIISPDLGVRDGGVVEGGTTRVPSRGLTGYLQQFPTGRFLTPGELGALMQSTGPAGGPLSFTADLGGPTVRGGLMRVTGVSVSAAGDTNAPELVVALLGLPRLPSEGSWSVGRIVPGSAAPQALDASTSAPLIRPNSGPSWHFADPADVNRLNAPLGTRYGLLQSTGTQRVFFPRPQVPQGSANMELPESPHLADVAALLHATGLFPDLDQALAFDRPPQITAVGDSLTVEKRQFSLAGVPPRKLVDFGDGAMQVLLAYSDADGKPATATVTIDPAASPSWTIDIGMVSVELVIPPYGKPDDPLVRLTGALHADALSAPTYKDLVVHYGGALSLVEHVFSRLQELARFLPGSSARLDVSFSNGRLAIRDTFTLPNLPLGIGQITDVALDLGLTVSLSPPSLDFSVGIANPDRPFHWLVSPLSGSGAIQVGGKDGNPTLVV